MSRLRYILNVLIIILLMAGVAIQRDSRVVGYSFDEIVVNEEVEEVEVAVEESLPDGTRVINSTSLAKDVVGFAGRTPVKVYVKNSVIERIEPLANSETPSFYDEVVASGLIDKWSGLSLSEAATTTVDAVSGATYTSVAIIENVRRAAEYGANISGKSNTFLSSLGLKQILGLLVVALGVIITLGKFRQGWLLNLQMVLNVVVLGFWCGSFLSLSTFVSWVSNGVNLSVSLLTFAMFIVVIIMPLFNRKGSYCHIHCPMGAAQHLLGKLPAPKIKIESSVAKFLNNLRYYILIALLFMMWLGVGFDLINYEVFSAFIFNSASTVVLIMGAVVLILSPFIQRPYCRFICPTGALITMSQKNIE